MPQLDGKVCMITGGAGSLGRATAELFVAEGAKVFLTDLNETALRDATEALAPNAACYLADVTQEPQVKASFEEALAHWGRLDAVVGNAGITGPISPITNYPTEDFDKVMAVHVRGAFLTCKYALTSMNDGGSIVIVSSVAGLRGDPGVSAYITAKHAQIGLMRSVSKEAAPRRIRVNTVHPGPISNDFQTNLEERLTEVLGQNATDFFNNQIPLARHADPTEIANAILYLTTPQSTFVTGTTLVADGGMST